VPQNCAKSDAVVFAAAQGLLASSKATRGGDNIFSLSA
jgi:hypothetical protein